MATQATITTPQSETTLVENWIITQHPLDWILNRMHTMIGDRHTVYRIMFWQLVEDSREEDSW